MLVYIILISLISLVYFLSYKKYINKTTALIISWVLVTLVFALRSYNIGVDTNNYVKEYNSLVNTRWKDIFNNRMEKGFVILLKLLTMVSKNPQLMIIVTSLIITTSVFYAIYKYSKDQYMSIMLFILLMILMYFMNVMRQALAISIIIYSLQYIIDNKKIKAILIIILAFFFHKVAIFFLPVVFAYNIKINYKVLLGILVLSIIGFFGFGLMSIVIAEFVPKFKHYLNTIYGNPNYFGALLDYVFFLIIFIVLVISLKVKKTNIQKVLLWIFAFQMFFQIFIMKMVILGRVATLFGFFIILLVPSIIEEQSPRFKKISRLYIYTATILYFIVIAMYRPEWNGAIPYEFFWNA